jgi:uncharacterized membrane protein
MYARTFVTVRPLIRAPFLFAFRFCPCGAGEELIGARAYRVVFALASLPLAVVAIVYFINHRYSGAELWNLRGDPVMHAVVWLLSFVSFFFLYPSTFNLLEVRHQAELHHEDG